MALIATRRRGVEASRSPATASLIAGGKLPAVSGDVATPSGSGRITGTGQFHDWDAWHQYYIGLARKPGAVTRYVASTGGSDSNSGTSRSSPKATIASAISASSSGDEIVLVGDSVTVTNNNSWKVASVPSGSNRYSNTIVRTEIPYLGVRIKWTSTLSENNEACRIGNSHIWLDGLTAEVTAHQGEMFITTGNYNRITRCASLNGWTGVQDYVGGFSLNGSYHFCGLCFVFGAIRYAYGCGGSTSTDVGNTFWLPIGRRDYYAGAQPDAIFNYYGNDDSLHPVGSTHHHYFQTAISIDSKKQSTGTVDDNRCTYGVAYSPKNAAYGYLQDFIFLNNEVDLSAINWCETKGGYGTGAHHMYVINGVAYDITGGCAVGSNGGNSSNQPNITVEGCTLGGTNGQALLGWSPQDGTGVLQNDLLLDYTGLGNRQNEWWTSSYNAFADGSAFGTNNITATQPSYLVRSVQTTQGSDAGPVGAYIEYMRGNIGEMYGEGTHDTYRSDRPIFPIPYEAEWLRLAQENRGSGVSGARGAAATSATTVAGYDRTLTSYIWEYAIGGVQTAIHSSIYPARPTKYVSPTGSDSNSGSQSSPWLTLQYAADHVSAGDIVEIAAGTYAKFTISNSGTVVNPIQFRFRAGCRIEGTTGSGITFNNVSYVQTVGAYEITGFSVSGIRASGATPSAPMVGNLIRGAYIHDVQDIGIYASEWNNCTIEYCVLWRVGLGNVETGAHGIYLANAGSDNTTIRDIVGYTTVAVGNFIHVNGDLSTGGDGLITGLTIDRVFCKSGWNNAISLDGVQNSTVQNSILLNTAHCGIRAYQTDGAAGPANNRFLNNTINCTAEAIKTSEEVSASTIFNNIAVNGIAESLTNSKSNNITTAAYDSNYLPTGTALNAGTASFNSVSAPTSDFKGKTRSVSTPDCGAIEV